MGAHTTDVTDASFEAEVLNSDVPVLVDFWATWCAPCKAIAPLVEKVAEEQGDKLKVVKLDIQSSPKTPRRFKVNNIPTLLLFKDGEVVSRKRGASGGIAAIRKIVEPKLS